MQDLVDELNYFANELLVAFPGNKYPEIIGKAADEITRLRAELERERSLFPADGIWVAKDSDGNRSRYKIADLSDEPIAEIVGNMGCYADAAARGITDLEQFTKDRTTRTTPEGVIHWVRPCNFDLALAALREVAAEYAKQKGGGHGT